jgi:4-carboxymuconolactone decarboxylase
LVICAVARHTSNQFEWTVHVLLAVDAGVSRDALAAVLNGRSPRDLRDDEERALKFVQCLMEQHGVPDSLFADAQATFGDEGVIELTTLIGYFATVCWIMNVAHTPSPANAEIGIIRPLA